MPTSLSTGWRGLAVALLALACGPAELQHEQEPEVSLAKAGFAAEAQDSQTAVRLQAISAIDRELAWASGLEGTVTRTTDGGATWQTAQVPGARDLQFRDVHAVDVDTAYLLAAGPSELSRIFKTSDGGASWKLQFLNDEPDGFLDCFDFWEPDRGLAYGDSVRGEFFVLATEDGETWRRIDATSLPPANPAEGGFAASGSCVETGSNGRAWIATGAGGSARVLRTADYGATWDFSETPIVRGEAAGLTSVLFRNEIGIAFGGDLDKREAFTDNVAVSQDGGATWNAGGRVTYPGGIYGGSWSPDGDTVLAAGPMGLSASSDGGHTWSRLSELDTWAVAFGDADTFWAVGPEGRITRFSR